MQLLRGKIALVTGANRGLGLETAKQLGTLGATVVVSARSREKAIAAEKELDNLGIDAHALALDISSESDGQSAYRYIEDAFGRLDVLVNNAGVWLESPSSSHPPGNVTSSLSMEIIRKVFESNFFSTVRLTQILLPLLKKSVGGRIVNVSSILGSLTLHSDRASPIFDSKAFAYNASKTALNAFTVHLAHELRDTAIKVNSIHPGWVRSDMGGENADMDIAEGSKTAIRFACLDEYGPTGGFFFANEPIKW